MKQLSIQHLHFGALFFFKPLPAIAEIMDDAGDGLDQNIKNAGCKTKREPKDAKMHCRAEKC